MNARVLTPANQITILRLVFVPLFAILVVEGHFKGALMVLAAAALSDAVDGTVARSTREVTPLGVALDPIADKILLSTAFITLAYRGAIPWWLTIVVLSRDAGILITALLISLVAGYRPFHPTVLGKASTVVQVATVLIALAHLVQIPWITRVWVETCVYLVAVFTVASALHYLLVVRQRYARPEAEEVETPAAKAE